MFYYILHLQKFIFAAIRLECCAGNSKNKEIHYKIINKPDIDNLCVIMQKIIENNNAHNEIYQTIVQRFNAKHVMYFKTPYYFQYNIHSNYKPNDIKELCDEIGKTNTNVRSDRYYHFYTKLFVESAQSSLNTIKTVFELHQKNNENNTECRKALEANPALFNDFIISINWLNSLLDLDFDMCLLYNYDHINTCFDSQTNKKMLTILYLYTLNTTEDKSIMTNIVKYIQQYYKQNDFTSNQKIIENESIQKIREWIDSKDDIQNKLQCKTLMKIAIGHINFTRSMQTKINYLSKPKYATNKKEIKQKYPLIDEQKEPIEKLQLDTIAKYIYNMKFNTLHMHTKEIIIEGISLITTFEENIIQLIAFTKHINLLLLNCIKEKLKADIQTSKVIPKNTKERCIIEIDNIACSKEISTTKIQETIEKTNSCDVFCDTLINIISHIDLDPMHKDKLTIIIQTIKNINDEINALYNTLITPLNGIIDKKHKLDEKRTEIEKIKQYIENHVIITKDIMEGIEADTLKEKAAVQSKKNFDWCQITAYGLLDEIIEIKGMIVETEALVYKILKEMKKSE
ncbi:hypothetical protein BDAP_000171 [Binucleata daphniae]